MINDSELILNVDGSIYHLNVLPEDIADTVITVGDPDRVVEVSKYFDRIELKKGKREFLTHTGYVGEKRVTVVSTGIGTDNIDIVINELDALVNIDFETKVLKPNLRSLEIIRIGTSGAIQKDIEMGSLLASHYAIGFDALMQYYVKNYSKEEQALKDSIVDYFSGLELKPYVAAADSELLTKFGFDMIEGITMTAPGFYAPQGRSLRSLNTFPDLIQQANSYRYLDKRLTNLEMETAGIYALSSILGHKALSINAILASRVDGRFCKNPKEVVEKAIMQTLERL